MPKATFRISPEKSSTVLMVAADTSHFDQSGIAVADMRYIRRKQPPPTKNMLQWVQPRKSISRLQ